MSSPWHATWQIGGNNRLLIDNDAILLSTMEILRLKIQGYLCPLTTLLILSRIKPFN